VPPAGGGGVNGGAGAAFGDRRGGSSGFVVALQGRLTQISAATAHPASNSAAEI